MPLISPSFLNVVAYFYRSPDEARAGKKFGGTGFLVSIPDETYPERAVYFYAVTNWHVAVQQGFSTIRVNTNAGDIEPFEFGPEDWHFNPKFDIAVIPMPFNPGHLRAELLPTQMFVQRASFDAGVYGIGSDVFMVGRFIDHDGGLTNRPAVRFGHISVMPAPIRQPFLPGSAPDSFCVDMNSRTGYSGSPVFVYRTPHSEVGFRPTIEHGADLKLLGIHWGQFPEPWEIKANDSTIARETESLIVDGQYVKGVSGMACVRPAWTILEVLKMPELVRLRREHSEKHFAP